MDHRGHPRSDSGHHRTMDREDHYWHPQQGRDTREGHWSHPDVHHHHRTHFTGPPARPDPYAYHHPLYPYGYGRADHQTQPSRQGYDYVLHGHWDYRDNYSYYDQDYYGRQHSRRDVGQWGLHGEPWRSDYLHEGRHKQEHSGNSSSEETRYEQRRDDSSQRYLSDREENPSRENEEVSPFYLGTLESSKTSGLSSSSYELSQYMNGGECADSLPQTLHSTDAEHQAMLQASAPLKFSVPHAVVSFGPAGQLVRVIPGFYTQENVSQLEIHSMEMILSETREQQEMRSFPGPLTREDLHKVDAIEFAQQEADFCMKDDKLQDKRSAALLWNLLILLCRQNGQIVGSDIAELLVQDSPAAGRCQKEAPTLIDFSEDTPSEAPPQGGEDLLTGGWSSFSSESSQTAALQSYTQLLLAGRKKEALESAMSSGLWGHALFLASKMDTRSYTTVLTRFTGQLTASDPLQTLFQLLSGRIPAVTTSCGSETPGDWRPHLAVMLSNETAHPAVHQRAIITMGDTLASRGLLHAAHVCYLTTGVPFAAFTQKAARLVLLGSSHRQSFQRFATNSAIQCTEVYEYCQTLGGRTFSIPSFQVYKLLYATRLLDCGLASQAFHYCEVIGREVVRQREASCVLTAQVIQLADRLRHAEGQFSDAGVSGAAQEPDWLRQLRSRLRSFQTEVYDSADTNQPEPELQLSALTLEDRDVSSDSGPHDGSSEVQSPEPELLYYTHSEGQDSLLTAASSDLTAAPHWPPLSVHSAPWLPTVASSQDLSYHNTDSAEVRRASLSHCPVSDVPSAAEGGASSAAAGTCLATGGSMLAAGLSHQEQNQQSSPGGPETPEPLKQSATTRTGWFSGWFRSRPQDLKQEQRSPVQTGPPPAASSCSPPPPCLVPPDGVASRTSSAGINPFSRKAGQQLR